MSVDKVVGPIFDGDEATGGVGALTARLVYEVSFTTATEKAVDALNATDGTTTVPVAGSAHPSGGNLVLKMKTARRQKKGFLFKVTLDYGTNDSATIGDKGISPLSRPARWSSSPRGSTQEIDRDANGKIIQTSAKETLTTQIPYADKNLSVEFYELLPASGLPPDYDVFFNKVNDDVFKGYAAKRVLISGISSQFTEELYDGETMQYYATRINFQLLIKRTDAADDPDTWQQRILNEGTQVLDSNNDPKSNINEKTNTVLSSPVKLNASGAILPDGSAPLFLNTNQAAPTTTGKLDVFLEADFDLLGV